MRLLVTLCLSFLSLAFSAHAAKFGPWAGDEPPGTIVIITSDHTLHYISDWGERISYPIAVGKDGAKWTGSTTVTHKRKNPEWRPTPNMRRKDPKLPAVVAPGPKNPLGTRSIYLAEGLLRIHGTSNPSSIGKDASSGCFRMYNEDVEELFEMVSPGAEVIVIP
jgi:lipoprotein-anchoring transpeptidase ErfK/SrfK